MNNLEKSPGLTPVIAAIGNPNTGKSTLFNELTGLKQKIGNYPGVTIEKHVGRLFLDGIETQLVDLPGTYSLSAQSPDEMVVIDILRGELPDIGQPDAILIVIDASNLRRNLYLTSQLLEMGVPVVIALNMMDVAKENGIEIDIDALRSALGVAVVPVIASTGTGLDQLRNALSLALTNQKVPSLNLLPEIKQTAIDKSAELNEQGIDVAAYELERALIDQNGYAENRLRDRNGSKITQMLADIRTTISQAPSLAVLDARTRYGWINQLVNGIETEQVVTTGFSDRIDRIASHPVWGSLIFLLLMAIVFQSVFAWAAPLMDFIDGIASTLIGWINDHLPAGAFTSLLTDGVIAGVGSVIIFLPQILVLFAFIIFLEDSGYMARAAFLMDRLMRGIGLSGRSFIPMLSSFACAVPGIMATRVISDKRDRLATLIAAPFMTCSARLPVYALLIAAFVPDQTWFYGIINLQGLVLLGLYLLGITGGVLTALLLKRTVLHGPTPTFLMEMPPYRWPSVKSVLIKLWERARIFLKRAGTVIFSVAVLIWALAYFPHPDSIHQHYQQQINTIEDHEEAEDRITDLRHQEAAAYLEQSFLGRAGKLIEPLFTPLGWDWKISAAVIASFPAREVVIAVLGTIYAVGADVDEEDTNLISRIKSSTWPNGEKIFTASTAIGLMIFYAFCLQCVATIATMRRETNSWLIPFFSWVYMTGLGYLGALTAFKLGAIL